MLSCQREHVVRGVTVAARECLVGLGGHALDARQLLHVDRLPQRDLLGPAGRVARVALDDPVDGHLGHSPPRRELSARDRDHPGGGLVQLGLSGYVHRLLRVARGDQGSHAGEGAGQAARAERRAEEGVDGIEQVVDVVGGWLDVVERALVVVVGGPDERVPEPRQREDRAAGARGDDGAPDERQVLVADRHVRAPAGPDAGQLGLVVELLRAQLVGPHTRGVDDVCATHLELRAGLAVACLHASRATVLLEQARDVDAVGTYGAEALRLAEDGQHEPHVVGLAVVEEVAAGRLARGERREQLDDLLTRDHAVALGAPGLAFLELRRFGRGGRLGAAREPISVRALGARAPPAAPAQAVAFDGHHVVEVQADAHQAIRPRAFEGGHDERQRPNEVRGEHHHQSALEQRLAHETEVEVLQVAKAAVNQLARAARGAGGVVGALEQRHAVAARGGVQRDPGARDAAAHDDDVELVLGQGRQRLRSLDHEPQSLRGALQLSELGRYLADRRLGVAE